MLNMDFEDHNAKVREVWDSYGKGKPIKVPVILDVNVRSWIMNPRLNTQNVTWKEYLEDKDVMWETQIKTQEWIYFNILTDNPMGFPEKGWPVFIDFQNVFEEAWFGAKVHYGSEPSTLHLLKDENKNELFERGIPDAFDGLGERAREYYEYFCEKAKNYTYKNIPAAKIPVPNLSTDGPFTIACGLRGAAEFMTDLLDDEDYAYQLLEFITEAVIKRIKKLRAYYGLEMRSKGIGFADDAITMISPSLYRDMVLPFHKRIIEELSLPEGKNYIHLCGNAQRFFPIVEKELNINHIDTGFPVDFGSLYDTLSPNTRVNGGPTIHLLQNGTPEQIDAEVKRILESGVMEKSKAFVLRDANNVAPCTPVENLNAMYQACEKYGRYVY